MPPGPPSGLGEAQPGGLARLGGIGIGVVDLASRTRGRPLGHRIGGAGGTRRQRAPRDAPVGLGFVGIEGKTSRVAPLGGQRGHHAFIRRRRPGGPRAGVRNEGLQINLHQLPRRRRRRAVRTSHRPSAHDVEFHRLAREVETARATRRSLGHLNDLTGPLMHQKRLRPLAAPVRTEDDPLAVRRPRGVSLVGLGAAARVGGQHRDGPASHRVHIPRLFGGMDLTDLGRSWVWSQTGTPRHDQKEGTKDHGRKQGGATRTRVEATHPNQPLLHHRGKRPLAPGSRFNATRRRRPGPP